MTEKFRFSLIIVLSIVILIIHSVYLTADTPDWFADYDTGLRVDEGYKTLSPRNLVLFGETKISEHDQYRGWFKNSILTQSLLYLTFSIFEPSLLVARSTNLIYFFLLAFMILWAHRAHFKSVNYAIIMLIIATEPFIYFFSRVALFEIAIALIVAVALLSTRIGSYKGLWIFILLAIIGTVLIKKSALVYLIPGMMALITYNCFYRADLKYIRMASIIIISIVALLLFLNYELLMLRIDLRFGFDNITKIITNPLVIYSPWIFASALYAIADIIIRNDFKMNRDPFFIAVSATAICGPFIFAFINYGPPRYYVALLPSYILIIAYWLTYKVKDDYTGKRSFIMVTAFSIVLVIALYTSFRAVLINPVVPLISLIQEKTFGLPRGTARLSLFSIGIIFTIILIFISYFKRPWACIFIRTGVIVSLTFTILVNSWHVIDFWRSPSFNSHHIRENLKTLVDPGDVIMGDWAPFFALGTDVPAIYSEIRWNHGDRVLLLRPSFFLYSGTFYDRANYDSYKMIDGLNIIVVDVLGEYYNRTIYLYRIHYPDYNQVKG